MITGRQEDHSFDSLIDCLIAHTFLGDLLTLEGWLEEGGARGLEEEEEELELLGLKSAKEAVVSLEDRSDRPACILREETADRNPPPPPTPPPCCCPLLLFVLAGPVAVAAATR